MHQAKQHSSIPYQSAGLSSGCSTCLPVLFQWAWEAVADEPGTCVSATLVGDLGGILGA